MKRGSPLGEKVTCGKSTQELLLAFQETGDQAPFEEIARRYAGMVYNVALQVTRDAHDAEDATQATFLTLAVHAKTAGKIRYVGPWLRKVSQRLALDIRRSKKRRTNREQRHAVTRAAANGNGDGTVSRHDLVMANGLQIEELRDILRNELDKLPAKYRMPLILYYFGGLTPEQIGKELKCKTSTLGVRLHRGRKMLADSLGNRGININSAIVGSMLLTLVDHSIRDNLVHACTHAAVHVAANGFVADATISAPVLAMMRGVTSAIRLNQLKGYIAGVLLLITTFTGSAQALKHFGGLDSRTLEYLNPLRLIRPLLQWLGQPPRLTIATPPSISTGLSSLTEYFDDVTLGALSWPAGTNPMLITPPHFVTGATAHVGSERLLASRHGSFNLSSPIPLQQPVLTLAPEPLAVYVSRTTDAVVSTHRHVASSPPSAIASQTTNTSAQPTPVTPSFAREVLVVDRESQVVGSAPDASVFRFTSGTMNVRRLIVGDTTDGTFEQTGGHVKVDEAIIVGNQADSNGTIHLSGTGTLTAPTIVVGNAGSGTIVQSGGLVNATTPEGTGQVIIADKPGSTGNYTLNSGSLTADQIIVGNSGSGLFQQFGGDVYVNSAQIGTDTGGEGTWNVTGGSVQVGSPAVGIPVTGAVNTSVQPTGHNGPIVVVGGSGSGTFLIRTDSENAAISERTGSQSATLYVRGNADGSGVIRGWGRVELTGPFIANGKVIADGFGVDRALDFSTVSVVLNAVENPIDGRNGWYARRRGSLKLPKIKVDGPGYYTWGELSFDREIDLVNSVRLKTYDQAKGEVDITLLDPLTPSVPLLSTGEHPLTLWQFQSSFDVTDIDLIIRYDEYLVSVWQKSEDDLALWVFGSGGWEALTGEAAGIDTLKNLIWGTAQDPQYFAVGFSPDNVVSMAMVQAATVNTPEPWAASGIGLIALGGLLRRRRR